MPSEPARARRCQVPVEEASKMPWTVVRYKGTEIFLVEGQKAIKVLEEISCFWQGNNIWGLVLRTRYSYECMLHFVWLVTLMVSEASARLLATG